MKKVDLVLKNGKYLDVIERDFIYGDIAVKDGLIVGIGKDFKGKVERDIKGKIVVPGFIDGHIHLESSVISPQHFAKIAAMHGTTAVVADPHEIGNILGEDAIYYMLQATKDLPIDVDFMIPSCVPATPFDESSGILDSKIISKIFNLQENRIIGLGEMMDFPGVIAKDPEVFKKIQLALNKKMRVDGHAPELKGESLEKYIEAGISSDHECSNLKEAIEKLEVAKKLNKDFVIMIREGTAAKNLEALVGLFDFEEYLDKLMFVTDDKHPEELKRYGHIDYIVKKAIRLGVNPISAYIATSKNAAQYFGLKDIGEIKEGKKANIVILDDINNVSIDSVYKEGEELTTEKLLNWENPQIDLKLDKKARHTIKMRKMEVEDINNDKAPKQVIKLIPGQIITEDGGATNDYNLEKDIIKVVVIESHKGTMHMSIAFLKGMGLKKGAVGTTVAHDSHYLIVAGTNDNDIVTAINAIISMQGGKVYVENGKVEVSLALPIAGLMTDENPNIVIQKMEELKEKAKVNEGIDAFMNLSFVSLGVIGDIRLLPGGAFDVNKWRFISEEEINRKWEARQTNDEEIAKS